MLHLKLSKFCSYLLLVINAECTAFSASNVPSSRVKLFRLPRGMVVNGAMFLRCGKAAVKPARAVVTKRANVDLFNMTIGSKVKERYDN